MDAFWVAFWTGEAIVFALTFVSMFGPLRRAHELGNEAFAEGARAINLIHEDGNHALIVEHSQRSDLLYEQCFAWRAVARRIQLPAFWLACFLLFALLVRGLVML